MSFNNFKTPINFYLEDVLSWKGLRKDKYGSYSLSVVLDGETKKRIKQLVTEYETTDPLHDDTIFIKFKSITDKQKKELLNNGRCMVKVSFNVKGVYTSEDKVNSLIIKGTGAGKIKDVEDELPADL